MSPKNLSVIKKNHKNLKNELNNKRISRIYKKFEYNFNLKTNFIVAVSGGPDSLALAFCAKIYSIKNKLQPKFFLIDHKLRSESTQEAKAVKQLLKKYSINIEILTWKGKKPSNNISSIARKKRYELLFKKCDKFKIRNILLGHHQDDLLENFFIRILRGSGLNGLVSLDKKSKVGNKNLLRPLLNENKESLIFLSKKVFNFYVKDPSNEDENFQRIRIRKLIHELQNNGLDKEKFLKTIKNLKYSNNIANYYVNKNLKNNSSFLIKSNRLILNKVFFEHPHEIVFRALSEAIRLIGKKYYSVRGKKIDNIISSIENNDSFKATLGGCIIEKVNQTVIIYKE
jgi:tRNA(Ile)-lysidine synthase